MWYRLAAGVPKLLSNPVIGGFWVGNRPVHYGEQFGVYELKNLLQTHSTNVNTQEKLNSFLSNPNRFKTIDGNTAIFKERLSKDLLNRLSFSASTSDLFMRYKKVVYYDKKYTQERGCEFEKELHQNLNDYLEHSLGYYKEYEKSSSIPLMIFSPTISLPNPNRLS